jgi:sarcosine oxidase subunit alpha
VETGRGIVRVKGGKRVTGVAIGLQAGEGAVLDEIGCDCVAMSGGWSPVVHLWSHCGGKLVWDADAGDVPPRSGAPAADPSTARAMVIPAGASNGDLTASAAALKDAPPRRASRRMADLGAGIGRGGGRGRRWAGPGRRRKPRSSRSGSCRRAPGRR